METFLTALHIVTCVILVLIVLVQSGKGAEISASFGGSSQTVFGSGGGANFFTKLTYGAAIVFMMTSLGLTIYESQRAKSVFKDKPPVATETKAPESQPNTPAGAPAAPATEQKK